METGLRGAGCLCRGDRTAASPGGCGTASDQCQQAKSEGLRWRLPLSLGCWALMSPRVRGEQRAFPSLLTKDWGWVGGVDADLLLSHLMDF